MTTSDANDRGVPRSTTGMEGLALLIDQVPCGLLMFDDEGIIEDANLMICEWTDLDLEILRTRSIETLFPPGGRIFLQTHFFPMLRMSGSVEEMYFALRRGDGRELPVLINAKRHVTAGRVVNVAVFVAIDNREQFEESLLRAWKSEQAAHQETQEIVEQLGARNLELARIEEELRRSSSIKDEFLGLVSHELRSPLTVISGAISILSRRLTELEPGTVHELLEEVSRESGRLFRLIEDMLIVARSGAMESVEVEPVLLQRVVARLIAKEETSGEPGVIETTIQSDLPPASAAEGFVEQIVRNFITNARKYGYLTEPIEVAVGMSPEDSSLRIAVGNAGKEMTEAEVQRFFEPFFRHENHRGTRPGLGLGLTVCKRLAEAQGGTIAAHPRPGGGLTIALELPIWGDDLA